MSYVSCVAAMAAVRAKCSRDDVECMRRLGVHTTPQEGMCECRLRGDSHSVYAKCTSGATERQLVTGWTSSHQPSRVVHGSMEKSATPRSALSGSHTHTQW